MLPRSLFWIGSVVAVLLAISTAPSRAADETLTIDHVLDMQRVREIALDPAADRIAYVLEVPRGEKDEYGKSWAELWVVGPDGAPRRFAGNKERISHPEWSPDGTRIAFLSDRDGGEDKLTGLFAISAAGGEAARLFEHSGSISMFHFSPDGRRVAFVAGDPKTEDEKTAEKEGRDWKIHDEQPKLQRLWLADLDNGAIRRWFDDDLDVSALSFSPDGKSVVFQAAATPRVDDEYMLSKIWRAAIDGKPSVLTTTEGKLGAMAPSPDGTTLAFLGATSLDDPIAQSVFVVPMSGGTPRNLTTNYEGSATELTWLDERTLLVVAIEREQTVAWRIDSSSGKREKLEWPGLIVNAVEAVPGRSRIALVAETQKHPAEVFAAEPGRTPRRLTRHAAPLEAVNLARQEVVRWKGAEGLDISGVLTWPLDWREGEKRPLVLQIHGGPEGTSLDGWTTSALYPVQLLAARGYFVLQPNYRGSGGRGVAFSKADHDDLGGKEFEDVLAGIDELVKRGLVDPKRVGTGGWSYGGFMSAWAATRYSDRFAAAIPCAGLTNWVAFAGTTDIPHEMSLVHWSSYWYDEPALHWERSPLAHINKARTPTLLVHGSKDDRVHPEQSLELYTALRMKGVPTRYVEYPREPHGLDERAHRRDYVERVLGWFDEHLGAVSPAPAQPEREVTSSK